MAEHDQQHLGKNIAYHFEWDFDQRVVVQVSGVPAMLNFYPIATEFKKWMLRQGMFSVLSKDCKEKDLTIDNPYSYGASSIAAILAEIINATYDFGSDEEDIDSLMAEVKRIRLYSEQVLYTARFCEVTIKQLLYCTQIPENRYKDSALFGLLSQDCKPCRKKGTPHKISLLGSIAHRYHLCLPIEQCLEKHLKLANNKRNIESAHSSSQILNIRTPEESKSQLLKDSQDTANELLHMLEHISDLEQYMMKEAQARFLVF